MDIAINIFVTMVLAFWYGMFLFCAGAGAIKGLLKAYRGDDRAFHFGWGLWMVTYSTLVLFGTSLILYSTDFAIYSNAKHAAGLYEEITEHINVNGQWKFERVYVDKQSGEVVRRWFPYD